MKYLALWWPVEADPKSRYKWAVIGVLIGKTNCYKNYPVVWFGGDVIEAPDNQKIFLGLGSRRAPRDKFENFFEYFNHGRKLQDLMEEFYGPDILE